MNNPRFSQAATAALTRFAEGAHQAIGHFRTGSERLGAAASVRWDEAFAQARPHLDAETRRNATRARRAFGRVAGRIVTASADGAATAVDTCVGAAIAGVGRAAAFAAQRPAR